MAIITKQRLSNLSRSNLGSKTFSGVLNEVKSQFRAAASTTIFLSHSHDDLKAGLLNEAIVLLSKEGVKLYIDSNDQSLPPITNGETANKLKQQIRSSDKFILIATNRAINSKWCNWELGFGDANKPTDKVALFPVNENSGSWEGAEYLNIYPRIEESNIMSGHMKIVFPDKRELALSNWLKS